MNLHKTRKSILRWECFLTSRMTMSDWPKGSCFLLCFLRGYFFSLEVARFKLSEANRDDLLSLSKWQPPHCSVSGRSDFNFTFKQSLYFICRPLGKCVLILFVAWIFPGVLWYPRFLNSWATHLCRTFVIIVLLLDITMIHFFLNPGLQTTCNPPYFSLK